MAARVLALVTDSTGISVIAREAFIGTCDATLSGLRVAGCGLAGTLRFRTTDDCFGVDFAPEWLLLSITEEYAIADVAIFQRSAISIGETVAVKGIAIALAAFAMVCDSAWITVIT